MNFTFFSSAHGIFSRIDHILGHKSSVGKFKKNWNHSKHLFWPRCSKIISLFSSKASSKDLSLLKHIENWAQCMKKMDFKHWKIGSAWLCSLKWETNEMSCTSLLLLPRDIFQAEEQGGELSILSKLKRQRLERPVSLKLWDCTLDK